MYTAPPPAPPRTAQACLPVSLHPTLETVPAQPLKRPPPHTHRTSHMWSDHTPVPCVMPHCCASPPHTLNITHVVRPHPSALRHAPLLCLPTLGGGFGAQMPSCVAPPPSAPLPGTLPLPPPSPPCPPTRYAACAPPLPPLPPCCLCPPPPPPAPYPVRCLCPPPPPPAPYPVHYLCPPPPPVGA